MPAKKPNRFTAFVNSPTVAALLLATTAVGCFFGAAVAYDSATALRDHGRRAAGLVVEVHAERRDNYVVVEFYDTVGKQVTAEVGNYRWDPVPQVGDRPELVYDPQDPSGNVADVRTGPDFPSVWAFAVGGLLATALAVPTATGRLDWNTLR